MYISQQKLLILSLSISILLEVVTLERRYVSEADGHTKRMRIAESSYSSGCFNQATYDCSQLSDDARNRCFDDAYEHCEKWGVAFREWLEGG